MKSLAYFLITAGSGTPLVQLWKRKQSLIGGGVIPLMDDSLGYGYANLLNTGLLSCARTTYVRYVTDIGMVCA